MLPAQPRPLDWLRSIKVKLGAVVVLSVATTVGAITLFLRIGIPARYAFAFGLVVSLVVIQVLAHGMVMPLREMADATSSMAKGDYRRRVTATSQDEVGSLARSFNEMAERLESAEQHRQELAANVSHELRTPIASLRARLENLADGIEPLDQAAVDTMLGTTERLSSLVDQLLELSQFESGAVALDRTRFSARALITAATTEIGPLRSDVRVEADIPNDLMGIGDRARLHEVLVNLLSNAMRYSPTDGCIEVRASATPFGLRIEVADEGPGIPASEAERIFDRFHRLDSARSKAAGGAGLGLAITRSIVNLHGGSVRAEPAEPHGCRMVIDLPG
ncbi:MAG: ATP-binding protein [Lacisediminihabitans sp.]